MKKDKIILMYHAIGSQDNGEIGAKLYAVSSENFRRQMKYIATLNSSEAPKFVNSSIVITFDDGDITNYKYAYPILKEFGLKGYFFVILSKIGTRGYMNCEQILELQDAEMIIGSHGINHKILTELSDDELNSEIVRSKRLLEDNLMQSVDYFSVPRGFYNKKIIAMAKQAGYKAIFTSNSKDTDGFKFGRIPVKNDWDLEKFVSIVNNGFSIKDKAKELAKNSSKKILGVKNYDRLRTRILKK